MKALKNKLIWISILSGITGLQAQISGFIQGDENYTLTLAFHNTDTLVVVTPQDYLVSDQDKTDIESYVFWEQYQKRPVYIYKSENELQPDDFKRHLQFYGPFCEFKDPDIRTIPFKPIPGGFAFNDETFSRPNDSFFYLNDDATRLFTCRNSTEVPHQYANLAAGYFPLYIFRGTELYFSGYGESVSGKSRINDIMKMRQSYFRIIQTKYFSFGLANDICSDSLIDMNIENADQFLENLCRILKTDTSLQERIKTYIYRNMTDLQNFLSISPHMTVYGKSIGEINHLSTFDMAVFQHETAHTIIGKKIGFQSNSFFSEGFAVYTGYCLENDGYENDVASAKEHLDLLTVENITGPDHRFYALPGMYQISGVFTRYTIEKTGIDLFKEIYASENIEKAFDQHGYPLSSLISEFQDYIENLR
ncbi:hypothetical protein [Saccharicrinis sp. FJH54]|uniref:hypothetical protein n=1 Tax=Saccharicrinis sp. FJH54 TaxID=3344665 RepID=UPI0035D43411